jgi:hypothetical protein
MATNGIPTALTQTSMQLPITASADNLVGFKITPFGLNQPIFLVQAVDSGNPALPNLYVSFGDSLNHLENLIGKTRNLDFLVGGLYAFTGSADSIGFSDGTNFLALNNAGASCNALTCDGYITCANLIVGELNVGMAVEALGDTVDALGTVVEAVETGLADLIDVLISNAPLDIPNPAGATAEDCALKINEILAYLRDL